MHSMERTYRVLFLCTGNSARSQMAEAVLNQKGLGRFLAESAGSSPVARVHPYALEALRDCGIAWSGHPPRGLTGLDRELWDFVGGGADPVGLRQPLAAGALRKGA